MLIKVILVDINPRVIEAWRDTFAHNEEVEVIQGSMLDQTVTAWVSPTNARGSMDGGLDAIIKRALGAGIEKRLQQEIGRNYGGFLPVGHAVSVPTDRDIPRFLISTPTMADSSQDISASMNVALACAAAFQAVHMRNAIEPGAIRSVALPGLGANTGKVPPAICADLMWTAYRLFRDREFDDFGQLRAALEEQVGTLDPMQAGPMPSLKAGGGKPSGVPKEEEEDEDFDDEDFDDSEEDEPKKKGKKTDSTGSVSDEDFSDD